MTKTTISIRAIDIEQNLLTNDWFLFNEVLKNQYNVKWVNDDSYDLLIQGPFGERGFAKEFDGRPRIVLASENINYPTNVSIILWFILKRFISLDMYVRGVQRFIPDKILNYSLGMYRRDMHQFATKPLPEVQVMGTNIIEHANFLSMPHAFNRYYREIPRLVGKKDVEQIMARKKKFCIFAVSNPHGIERNRMFKKLSQYKKVDSFGAVFHNMDVDRGISLEQLREIFREYKFVLCLENSFALNYISERLIDVMMSDSVAIYRGAPNVGVYFNTRSFINFEDCNSNFDDMLERIIELDQDDELYRSVIEEPWLVDNQLPQLFKESEQHMCDMLHKVIEK